MNTTATASSIIDCSSGVIPAALCIEIKDFEAKSKKEKWMIHSRIFVKGSTIIIRYVNFHEAAVRVKVFWFFYDDAIGQCRKKKIIDATVTETERNWTWHNKVTRASKRKQQFTIIVTDAETNEKLTSINYRFLIIPRLSTMRRVSENQSNILYSNSHLFE